MGLKIDAFVPLVNNSLLHLCGHRFEIVIKDDCLLIEGEYMRKVDLLRNSHSARDFFGYLRNFIGNLPCGVR